MSLSYMGGDLVRWRWGKGYGSGHVQDIYPVKMTCNTDGHETTRDGSMDDPVLHIRSIQGNSLVKRASEVEFLH